MSRPILFVGDIHLGRSPHRLAQADLNSSELSPVAAWRRVVRYAIENKVQAVVLAGDVVDQDKDRFEAFGHLHRGVADLVAAGIRTIGVAGNHDHIALPRLAERIEAFTLLGRGGRWERLELEGVDLIGWSFPKRHHYEDPLQSPGLDEALGSRRSSALSIGVLHADLDSGSSAYAPVRGADLAARDLAAWFLGHIHVPSQLQPERPIGYLGSLIGLNRGESGPRGPWLVQATSASTLTLEQVPLGPVYWTEIEVDLSELALEKDDAEDRIHAALEAAVGRSSQGDIWLQRGDFSAVGCTARLVGRVRGRAQIATFVRERKPRELVFECAGVRWVVVKMVDHTQPVIDLEQLAAQKTPAGSLAQLLCAVEAEGVQAIPASVRSAWSDVDPKLWVEDEEDYPLPDRVEMTKECIVRLLEQLLEQTPVAEPV